MFRGSSNEDIGSNNLLSVGMTDSPEFDATNSVLPSSNTTAAGLKGHRAVSTHHAPTCMQPSNASQPSQSRPRETKKDVSKHRCSSQRRQVKRQIHPSRTDVAYQQEPEGLVNVPGCLLKKHLQELVPVVISDAWEESIEHYEQSSFYHVKQMLRGSGDLCNESRPSQLQQYGCQSSTKIALQRAAPRHRTVSPVSLLLDSDKPETVADVVHVQYVSSTGDCLTQEMLWEVEALEDTKPRAPVTKENLRELDLQSIQNTITLRYDLCFDQGLFFQRVSGDKATHKQIKARIFYRYMSLELQAINHDLKGPCEACQESDLPRYTMPSRLACYFWSLLDLLIILVPDSEKDSIRDAIDPTWLTRRVRVGSFDAGQFSNWLHALLTRHCAPLRDAMAKEMQEKLSEGASRGDMDLLVEGMEILLCLLENMKIDIANHQIRTFKFLLITDTVSFLRDCFTKMHDKKQLQLQDSKEWFKNFCKHPPGGSDFESFLQGFIQLLCASEDEFELHTAFRYGEDRIHYLRNELFDYVHLEICLSTYRERLGSGNSKYPGEHAIKHRILQLMSNSEGMSEGIRPHVEEIDLEISRAVLAYKQSAESRDVSTLLQHTTLDNPDSAYSEDLEFILNTREEGEFESLSAKLFEPTLTTAKRFLKMDTLQISNYQRSFQDQRASKEAGGVLPPDITDLSGKVAHMGVIHWQIWAELAYLDQF